MKNWFLRLSLPNKLSFSRIVAIPLVVAALSRPTPWLNTVAAIIFVAAALTDLLDGHLARRQDNVTPLGTLLDPLADKLLISTALIMVLYLGRVHFLFVILIIGRDIAVNTLRGIAASEHVVLSASPLAKHKTSTLVIALTGLIMGPGNQLISVNWYGIGYVFLNAALVISLISGFQYFRDYVRQLNAAG